MNWKIGKVLKPDLSTATNHSHHHSFAHIDSLSFHNDGEFLVATSSQADRLFLVNALTGVLEKTINSQRAGCRLAQFTHHPNCVLYASNHERQETNLTDVYLLSFHDNTILRRFNICSSNQQVDSLSVNPINDLFMVSGRGGCGVKLFDMSSSSSKPIAEMNINSQLAVLSAFDPQGLVFAVCREDRYLQLFDVSRYQSGPFASFDLTDPYGMVGEWSQCLFSPDGKLIMINDAKNNLLHIIDSFEGQCVNSIKYSEQATNHRFTADWSHDSSMVVIGEEHGNRVNWFIVSDGKAFASLEGHTSYPLSVAVNPRHSSFASACSNIALWL